MSRARRRQSVSGDANPKEASAAADYNIYQTKCKIHRQCKKDNARGPGANRCPAHG